MCGSRFSVFLGLALPAVLGFVAAYYYLPLIIVRPSLLVIIGAAATLIGLIGYLYYTVGGLIRAAIAVRSAPEGAEVEITIGAPLIYLILIALGSAMALALALLQ